MSVRYGCQFDLFTATGVAIVSDHSIQSSGETTLEISNVWKIFGEQADVALRAIQEEGLGKAEVLQKYNAVVGVADVSFDVKKGEIFCVMGLSGSGKSTLCVISIVCSNRPQGKS